MDQYRYFYGPSKQDIVDGKLNLPIHYGNNYTHSGYGEPTVDPNMLTYSKYAYSASIHPHIPYMLQNLNSLGHSVNTGDSHLSPDFPIRKEDHVNPFSVEIRFSALYFRNLLEGRNPVTYSKITVYHGDPGDNELSPSNVEGKVEYNYDIYDHLWGDSVVKCTPIIRPDVNYIETISHRADENMLTSKITYYWNGSKYLPKDEEKYNYNIIYNRNFLGYQFFQRFIDDSDINVNDEVILWYNPQVINFDAMLKSSILKKVYSEDGCKSNTFFYGYNNFCQIDNFTVIEDGNQKRIINYYYPTINSDSTSVISKMLSAHLLNTSLGFKENVQSLISKKEYAVGGYKVEYGSYTIDGKTMYLPKVLYKRENNIPLGKEKYKEIVRILSYTANGNPTESVDALGGHTAYLWGYDDRYLIAELQNCTYSQALSAYQSLGSPLNASKLSMLGKELKNVMVKTWTYQPLCGVVSESLPNGMTYYYSYDGLGRKMDKYYYEGNLVSEKNKRVVSHNTYKMIAE